MCLITTQKKPLVATEDITVYKLLRNDLMSCYTGFQYKPDKLYQTELLPSLEWCCFDLTDQRYLDKHFTDWEYGQDPDLVSIGSGFHAALSSRRFDKTYKGYDEIVFKFTIPKGSLYYLGFTDLIVSNQIICNGKL